MPPKSSTANCIGVTNAMLQITKAMIIHVFGKKMNMHSMSHRCTDLHRRHESHESIMESTPTEGLRCHDTWNFVGGTACGRRCRPDLNDAVQSLEKGIYMYRARKV